MGMICGVGMHYTKLWEFIWRNTYLDRGAAIQQGIPGFCPSKLPLVSAPFLIIFFFAFNLSLLPNLTKHKRDLP